MSTDHPVPAAALLRRALMNARGDDLARAERAFRGLPLDEQHRQSGKTRSEVLEYYREHERQWQSANDLLERMLKERGL